MTSHRLRTTCTYATGGQERGGGVYHGQMGVNCLFTHQVLRDLFIAAVCFVKLPRIRRETLGWGKQTTGGRVVPLWFMET